MTHFVILSSLWPSRQNPLAGAFVRKFADALVRAGTPTTVIAPRSMWKHETPSADAAGVQAPVLHPLYPTFSNFILPPLYYSLRLTSFLFRRCAQQTLRTAALYPSYLYGHFLYPSGYAAVRLARQLGIPGYVALGEGNIRFYERHYPLPITRRWISQARGVITVSEENRAYCVERLGVAPSRIGLFPNAADTDLFFPHDRLTMRRKYGLPLDAIIVVFVGHFNHNKGPDRVVRAITDIPNVKGIFLGQGPIQPRGEKVLLARSVPGSQIAELLSAGDVFVLPTIAEASSNSVAEAMACGLPVVTSDIPSMRRMVDPQAGLLVNPCDEGEIRDAIRRIVTDSELHAAMAAAALRHAAAYNLTSRASQILSWIRSHE